MWLIGLCQKSYFHHFKDSKDLVCRMGLGMARFFKTNLLWKGAKALLPSTFGDA